VKPSTGIVAAAVALTVLAGVLVLTGINLGGWSIHLPRIEGAMAKRAQPAAITTPAAPAVTSGLADRIVTRIAASRPASNATTPVSTIPTAKQKSPKDFEAGVPYWCFRTYYPGMPWMMNSDERNTGNAARSELEYIWNGERSLRLDFVPLEEGSRLSNAKLRAQRNVLWQAIRAAPYRGKRIVFRPTLRAMPGATLSAFLRSWDGATGAPQLTYDRSDPAKTPTVIWSTVWGNPRLLLYVPMDAEIIFYGIVQSSTRPVWIDHVELEADPVPGLQGELPYMGELGRYLDGLPPIPIDPNWVWKKPENLDFELVYPGENEIVEDSPPLPC
jgi:hypothetical protein